jgi:hypothetical protein
MIAWWDSGGAQSVWPLETLKAIVTMATFVAFIATVAVYIVFLLWCLAPLLRRPRRRWMGWLRVGLALLLSGAVLWPLLASPILLPIYAFNPSAGRWLTAAVLFPRTLPIYVRNVMDRKSATATVIDVSYPVEIGGVRYAPVVRTACTTRRMVDIDFGALQSFETFPTASGGDLAAKGANFILALDQSPQLCSHLKGLQPGTWNTSALLLRVYVIRGEADKTQMYELHYSGSSVAVDDIVLLPPQIIRIALAPATDTVSLDALWPMRQRGESGYDELALIDAYRRLPAGINACVEFVLVSLNFSTMTPKISRLQKTDYPHDMPAERRNAYCRDNLGWRIPRPTMSDLTPAG